MTQTLRIGYIVPQFPGQTHIFFWREILALEEMGHEVHVFSTRKPPKGLIAHDWSDEAMARTTYLGSVNPVSALIAGARLLPQGLPGWMLREGARFGKDALVTLSAAQQLSKHAKALQLDHIHAHSCARASLIACFANKLGAPNYSHTLHWPLVRLWTGAAVEMGKCQFCDGHYPEAAE